MVKNKYRQAFEIQGSKAEKIDHLLFMVDRDLADLADKKGKVKYEDVFKELTDARIAIHYLVTDPHTR